MTDHCPLLISGEASVWAQNDLPSKITGLLCQDTRKRFRGAWAQQVDGTDPIKVLMAKFQRIAKALKAWSRLRIGDTKLQMHIALEIIFQLEQARERHTLTQSEKELRSFLKARLLGLAAIQWMRWRQRSLTTSLKLGGANTTFFHSKANSRRRKFIHTLKNNKPEGK